MNDYRAVRGRGPPRCANLAQVEPHPRALRQSAFAPDSLHQLRPLGDLTHLVAPKFVGARDPRLEADRLEPFDHVGQLEHALQFGMDAGFTTSTEVLFTGPVHLAAFGLPTPPRNQPVSDRESVPQDSAMDR
jgi:hypothetical protein